MRQSTFDQMQTQWDNLEPPCKDPYEEDEIVDWREEEDDSYFLVTNN